jgi:nitrile hydratase accessory protein
VNQRLTLAEVAAACAADGCGLPMPPQTSGGGHFSEPWQAHAFAMVLLLHERGAFSWPQWAETLARHIRAAQAGGDPDDGSHYYRHWLGALEDITIAQGIATADQLHTLEHAWADAARHTPHGQPIELRDGG